MSSIPTFTRTCNKSYDRHSYRVNLIGGRSVTFDGWMEATNYWMCHSPLGGVISIEVIDRITKRDPKGF